MHAKFLSARNPSSRARQAGFSIAEAVIAVGVIGISLGAMMTLNGQQLRLVRAARDTNAATLYQQERVEQLRQLRWPDLTDASYIANTYLPNQPRSKDALGPADEIIRIAAYPSATQGSKPLQVVKAATGTRSVDSTQNGFALTNERLVRVDMTLSWKGADGRAQQRSVVTLISNGGVTRSNLPAMGPVSGGPYEAFNTPAPVATPVPTTATPVPTTTTPVPTTTTPVPSPTTPVPATPTPKKGRGKTGNPNGAG